MIRDCSQVRKEVPFFSIGLTLLVATFGLPSMARLLTAHPACHYSLHSIFVPTCLAFYNVWDEMSSSARLAKLNEHLDGKLAAWVDHYTSISHEIAQHLSMAQVPAVGARVDAR